MNSKYKSVYATNDNCMGIFTYLTHLSDLLKRPPNNRFEMRNFQRREATFIEWAIYDEIIKTRLTACHEDWGAA